MAKRSRTRRSRTEPISLSRGGRTPARYSAAEFKARCLKLMDRVRETGAEYVVTKHGKPVAKLVPYMESRRQSFFGSLEGSLLQYDRPFDPIDGEYDIDRE
jgi:prevent-host-death family protein